MPENTTTTPQTSVPFLRSAMTTQEETLRIVADQIEEGSHD